MRLYLVPLLLVSSLWACRSGSDSTQYLGALQKAGSNSSPAKTVTAAGDCSLSPSDQRTAVKSFKALMPVFQHPRCANCHGGIDFFSPSHEDLHGGGAVAMIDRDVEGPDGTIIARQRPDFETCGSCHDAATDWRIPAPVQDISFAGRTAGQICQQIKRASGNPPTLLGHIQQNEDIRLGFEGRRGHKSLSPNPPPLTKEAFNDKVGVWLQAMKATESWPEPSTCGCDSLPLTYHVTFHRSSVSEKRGPQLDVTYRAVLRQLDEVDEEGNNFAGDGSYSLVAVNRKANCMNDLPEDYEKIEGTGKLRARATVSSVNGNPWVVFSLTPLSGPKLKLFTRSFEGLNQALQEETGMKDEDVPFLAPVATSLVEVAGDSGQKNTKGGIGPTACDGMVNITSAATVTRLK